MTQAANTYAQALYDLAKDENLGKTILEELTVLKEIFAQNPQYSKLLSAPDIPKQERCGVLDEAFRGKVHPYVLNFMKILTEKGYIRQFPSCCDAYRSFYNEDNGILVVKAVSAIVSEILGANILVNKPPKVVRTPLAPPRLVIILSNPLTKLATKSNTSTALLLSIILSQTPSQAARTL